MSKQKNKCYIERPTEVMGSSPAGEVQGQVACVTDFLSERCFDQLIDCLID